MMAISGSVVLMGYSYGVVGSASFLT